MQQNHPKLPFHGDFDFQQAWLAVREWRDPSTAPYMKRKAMEYFAPRVAFWLSVVSLAGHWYWASTTHCGVNFQRGGAIVVLAAAALYAVLEWHDPKSAMLSGGRIQRIWFYNPAFLLPLLGAAGTLIWGYGDLLPFFGSAGCSSSN
ncbi:hypothetical protein [Bradyrhizobium sp. DOA1]|uniref:hypothetical protein n=1 Tax=Bradyrhizobium sp. DOA1 TaxID=1126616 RepID=UPI00077C3A0E|nr:hypothetical protein [Bradyrhizobium sp. DOA1]KYH02493.1 hypothetical protein SE91_32105 [Bradyrhizobium sp. DOA1]